MAISIDWGTKVISVPQADLTFVSGTLYSLDTNDFWDELKALEESAEGMPFLDTQSRNPELTIAGVTYAATIEIINGYTVTFEDAQYAVRLDGTNNNIFDEGIINRNQVSIISGNSAGLQIVTAVGGGSPASSLSTQQSLQLDEIHGQIRRSIYIDTSLGGSPIGTGYQQTPYNNVTTAIDDAEASGITRLVFISDATLDRQMKNFTLVGIGQPVLDLNGQNCNNSDFEFLHLDGSYTGSITATDCGLEANLGGLNGKFFNCGLHGKITLAPGARVLMQDCFSEIPGLFAPEIDLNGSGSPDLTQDLSIRNYSGGIILSNSSNVGNEVTLEMSQGKVTLAASNTAGVISVRGLAFLDDLSTGSTVDITALLQPLDVASILTFVENIQKYEKNRTEIDKTAKTLTVYDDDGTTPIRVFSLRDSTGTPSITEITERLPIGPGSPV